MPTPESKLARRVDAARLRAYCTLLAACALSGCGSQRLDTAVEPSSVGGSASGAASSGGTLGSSGAAGADAGAGGQPAPLRTEELFGLADFGASYMVGPISAERFGVSGQVFSEAWRATMTEPPSSPWIAQLVVPLNKPVAAGQLVHVSFWLSCETPGTAGDCYTEYIFERASDPWEKSVTFVAHSDQAWGQKNEFFSVVNSYEAGAAHMVFRLGYEAQVIALGGLELQAVYDEP